MIINKIIFQKQIYVRKQKHTKKSIIFAFLLAVICYKSTNKINNTTKYQK